MTGQKRKPTCEHSYLLKKRVKLSDEAPNVHHSVLSLCYPKVLSLRSYCISHLPICSRVRRIALQNDSKTLLDTCLVGVLEEPSLIIQQQRTREFVAFTQSQMVPSNHKSGKAQICSVGEVLDFVVWALFNKTAATSTRPRHILCNGLQRASANQVHPVKATQTLYLPGIAQLHPNETLTMFKSKPWSDIFSLLGTDAETMFSSLLLDCGLFVQLNSGADNFYQLSGTPISDLKVVSRQSGAKLSSVSSTKIGRTPSEISFVRSRILYAKPFLNSKGHIRFGLQHVHVLQRSSDPSRLDHTTRIMRYIFPRQFNLHNVFTSHTDMQETSQPFHDYTYREVELSSLGERNSTHLPRRLRGAAVDLIRKLQRRHRTCPYTQLLRHFCPLRNSRLEDPTYSYRLSRKAISGLTDVLTQPLESLTFLPVPDQSSTEDEDNRSFLRHSTPTASVAAFCKSIIKRILPKDLLGRNISGVHNWTVMFQNIERFVKLRKHESMSLQDVLQRIRLTCIEWLCPSKIRSSERLSGMEVKKRLEILHEVMYYIFDSILIPLVRSNFYVTESGAHRNKLFYFRHDIWKQMVEPSLTTIKLTMYEPLQPSEARRMFSNGTLGYSQVRLLPKDESARVITNLKRRSVNVVGGRRTLGPSINSQLGPLFSVLNYERSQKSSFLGGAIFSIGGIHERLKEFQSSTKPSAKYFFVKMDIKSCFDSIPHEALVESLKGILDSPQYRTSKYTKMKLSDDGASYTQKRLRKQFIGIANPTQKGAVFTESVANDIVVSKRRLVVAETGNQKVWDQGQLLRLLHDHVRNNIVKIGKRHFRQKDGIPQGSILSSLLCSFFYSAFEHEVLGFLTASASILLRLIDDFLLITTNEQEARQFLQAMSIEDNKYGIVVNTNKTLVNFDITISGQKVPRYHGNSSFPYCGMSINMTTLAVSKDRQRKDWIVSNGLTVDHTRKMGFTFEHKVMSYLKLQMHAMLLDMSLNSRLKVFGSLLEIFMETAMKLHQYIRNVSPSMRPSESQIIEVFKKMTTLACKLCYGKQSKCGSDQVFARVSRPQMSWIASAGLEQVLQSKQAQYSLVLEFLRAVKYSTESRMGMGRKALEALQQESTIAFARYIY